MLSLFSLLFFFNTLFLLLRYTGEAFHFVSYVPINDRLIELDGLRNAVDMNNK